MKVKFATLLIGFIVLFFTGLSVQAQSTAYSDAGLPAPSVTSDKDDYAPGEIAHITGTGWTLDQQVHVEFKEEPDYPDFHIYDINVDIAGNWSIDYPIEVRHLGVKFTVLVDGKQTNYRATTIFTDANVNFNASGLSGPPPTITASFTIKNTTTLAVIGIGSKGFTYPGPSATPNIAVNNNETIVATFNSVVVGGDTYTAPAVSFSSGNSGIGLTTLTAVYCTTPVITTPQPISQSLTYGLNTTFTVAARGSATLGYQWQEFVSSWNPITNGGVYSNATTAILTLIKPGDASPARPQLEDNRRQLFGRTAYSDWASGTDAVVRAQL